MKAAIYARVSTAEQTPDNQIQALTSWAESRGFEVVKVYQEAESAWHSGHQHELALLKRDATHGKFNIVLIWSLDRLSREGPLKVLQLVDSLRKQGVRVVSMQEPWTEIDGPLNDVLYSLVAWVAKFKSDRRSERTRAGLERVRQYGSKSGKGIGERSKDKGKRKRTGYLLRYADQRAKGSDSLVTTTDVPNTRGRGLKRQIYSACISTKKRRPSRGGVD
jgi:DNA invertase Pin-like site-specific DNA recombinase